MVQTGGMKVDLVIVEENAKNVEASPEGVRVGTIELQRWQVHRIDKRDGQYPGTDAYLVRVNFDLDFLDDLPPMRWFEFGLSLGEGTPSATTILDAIPRGSRTPKSPSVYTLSRNLNLAPEVDGVSAPVVLPAVPTAVHVHGIGGGRQVRWRFSAGAVGVIPGSYATWLVLIVPAGQDAQPFQLTARFDLEVGPNADYCPGQLPTSFRLPLRDLAQATPIITPTSVETHGTAPTRAKHRILICYAHESPEHRQNARRLANLLADSDMDVHYDQVCVGARKDWHHWMVEETARADFVLVVASPKCKAAGNGPESGDASPGIRAEMDVLRNLLQRHREYSKHVLPVVLPGESPDNLPLFLLPYTRDHYCLADFRHEDADELIVAMDSAGKLSVALNI